MKSTPPPHLLPKLIALHEDVKPAEYTLTSETCTIGRSSMCRIVIANRKRVSRLHARIEPEGPRFVLRDTSANGTFVNSSRIRKPHLLQDRDLIGLGTTTSLLRFVDKDATYIETPRLTYDERLMAFSLDDQPLTLTPQQFRLLFHLYQHAGEVCTRESCAQVIWGRSYDPALDADALDRAVANLRRALREIDDTTEFIQTRRGVGYLLES